MQNFSDLGIQIPQILLPGASIDLSRWAVIAVDQFTSQPEYWQNVEKLVGDAPSTFNMVLPEIYLGKQGEQQRIARCNAAMEAYLAGGYLVLHQGMLLVERSCSGRNRHGILLALDLEKYDYHPGSKTLIRASEQTILDRIPPRRKIRQKAALEIPHILVLIDDPGRTVIEPLAAAKNRLKSLYDFELMLGGGHLRGYLVDDEADVRSTAAALEKLANPHDFASRHNLPVQEPVLLFAVGDGNHSLATAKSIWEDLKADAGSHHPARYALVEVVNIHDEGLLFEPIHRILFHIKEDVVTALQDYFGDRICFLPWQDRRQSRLDSLENAGQIVWLETADEHLGILFSGLKDGLALAALQSFLDDFLRSGAAGGIDYVHGEEIVSRLGTQPGNAGFFLPPMGKDSLFPAIIRNGVLPRKAFSMGEAREKRYYLECRQISAKDALGSRSCDE